VIQADTCIGVSADRRTVNVFNVYARVRCKMGCLEVYMLCCCSY